MVVWMKRLLAPPALADEEKVQTVNWLHTILLVLLAMTVVVAVLFGILGAHLGLALTLLFGVFSLGLLVLVRWGHWRLAGALLVLQLLGVTTLSAYTSNGIDAGVVTAYFMLLAIAALLLGGNGVLVFALLSILALWGLFYAGVEGHTLIYDVAGSFVKSVIISLTLVTTAIVLRFTVQRLNKALERARCQERALTKSNRNLAAEVAERRRVGEELRIKGDAISSSISAIAMADLEGNLVYVNDAFLDLWGYDDEAEVLNSPPTQLWQVGEGIAEVMNALRAQGSWVGEMEGLKKDGSSFNAQLSATVVTDEDGTPVCLMASFIDVTDRKRAESALRRQLKELTALHAVALAGAETTGEDVLIERATEVIGSALYPDNFGVGFVDESADVVRFHYSYRGVREELIKEFQVPLGRGVTGHVAITGQPWRVPDVTCEPVYLSLSPGMRSELCVPIRIGERIVGVINAESRYLDAFSAADERLMMTFAGQLATAIEKIRLFDQVRQLATTDSLTGVSNRRHFFDLAKREFDRARRYGHPLCAIMLDIDRFKQVNDSHGHATGDQVLREVAQCCRERLREVDLLARYGGDEFAILLPETDLASAQQVAKRLHQEIAQVTVHTEQVAVSVSASLGIGPLDDECPDVDSLLQRADQALYAAKHAGRNCVRAWQTDLTSRTP